MVYFRIVIVDEAHNVEQVCEDSASLSVTSTDLAGAIRECDEVASVIDGGIGLDPNADPQDLDKVLLRTPEMFDFFNYYETYLFRKLKICNKSIQKRQCSKNLC